MKPALLHPILKLQLIALFTLSLQWGDCLADLRPIYLKMELSSTRSIYQKTDLIQLDITLTNLATRSHPVLLPGMQNHGKKIISLSFFTVDENNFYTEVYREKRDISMVRDEQFNARFKYLEPKESITVPLFLNDSNNFFTHIQSHHSMPDLPPGEYQVLAWYNPFDSEYSEYAFNQMDPFGHEPDTINPELLTLPFGGTQSNYFTLTIADSATAAAKWTPTVHCSESCKLCTAIDKNAWKQVRAIIDKQSSFANTRQKAQVDSSWTQQHRNIAGLGPWPDAILASLPSSTGRNIIFKNDDGLHYYSLRWQIGIIYPIRSRVRYFVQWATRWLPPIKGEELDYLKLVYFSPY